MGGGAQTCFMRGSRGGSVSRTRIGGKWGRSMVRFLGTSGVCLVRPRNMGKEFPRVYLRNVTTQLVGGGKCPGATTRTAAN